MKNIVIVEDESIAAQHLARLVADLLPGADILPPLQSIEECVEFFGEPHPELTVADSLVFMDIHLADGLSFRIFDSVDIDLPIVFTTAYDQYALDAFKAGGFDYLLKPIAREDLEAALQKIDRLKAPSRTQIEMAGTRLKRYRSHFLIPVRDRLIPVPVDQIACLYLEDKITRAVLLDGHSQIIPLSLDHIMEQLDPDAFFRANRQYIVAHRAIEQIAVWPISKLALSLSVRTPERIIISKAKVPEFKQWYTK